MPDKYNERYENQIILMAQKKIESGTYKAFDNYARVIAKKPFPELVKAGKTSSEGCLIICNREGETIVLTWEFRHMLFMRSKVSFNKSA